MKEKKNVSGMPNDITGLVSFHPFFVFYSHFQVSGLVVAEPGPERHLRASDHWPVVRDKKVDAQKSGLSKAPHAGSH